MVGAAKLLYLISLLFGLAGTALAENAIIQGKVTDYDGDPIQGASVSLGQTKLSAITNQYGEYRITDVSEGTYKLRVTAYSYQVQAATVMIASGQTVVQNFSLQIELHPMEELVVTGTTTAEKKIESSTSVSSLSTSEINDAAPRSTTEYLRRIPGFTRVESSGGEVNQNVSVRGLLGVTSVNIQEDGMVVYPSMELFFMNADNLIRPDENLERIEILRGGTSPIFGSSTAGATLNLINKTGGSELHGTWKTTVGTGRLARFDFNFNGPLSDDWRFNAGGFYRYDHGVRDPGYPGTRGGQLKTNFTRLLPNGFLRFSLKHIDDRNLFVLPLPFQNPDNPDYVPGFSETGSFYSGEGITQILLPNRDRQRLPLDEGIKTKGTWLTGHVGFNFGGDWQFEDIARVMSVDHDWNGLPSDNLLSASDFAQSVLSEYIKRGIVPESTTYQLMFTNHFDPSGNKLPFDTANGLIRPGGLWHIEKPLSDFSNLMTIRKTLGSHHLSFGTHFAYYTQSNTGFFANILTDVRDQPRFLDLVLIQPDGSILDVTKNGFRQFLSFFVNGEGNNTLIALFTSDEFKLGDRWRIDLGIRYERANYFQVTENLDAFDLDGDPGTLYDLELWGNQTFRRFEFDIDSTAFSTGLNYQIVPDRLAVYGSFTRGFKLPALDEFLFEPNEEFIKLFKPYNTNMFETGVKYSADLATFTGAFFYGRVYNLINRQIRTDPVTGFPDFFSTPIRDSTSWGMEFEILTKPTRQLQLRSSATLVSPNAPEVNLVGQFYDGLTPAVFDFDASYSVFRNTRVIFDWHYVGRRFSDSALTRRLADYSYVNIGASHRFAGTGFTITARVLNLTQSKGLEEHNPLGDNLRDPSSNLLLARPLLPRRFLAEIRYDL